MCGCDGPPSLPVELTAGTAAIARNTWQVVLIDVQQIRIPAVRPSDTFGEYQGIPLIAATAFAVGPDELASNAHVVSALLELLPTIEFPMVLAVQHETGRTVRLVEVWNHPDYVPEWDGQVAPDLAILRTSEELPSTLSLADAATLRRTVAGEYLLVCGFPGGVIEENSYSDFTEVLRPRASCHEGILTEITTLDGRTDAPFDELIAYRYQIATAPGSSGSPVVNADGEVIAVHAYGYPQSGRGGGTRSDELVRLRTWVARDWVKGEAVHGARFALFCEEPTSACPASHGECRAEELDLFCLMCDADGDGFNDRSEIAAGTDPCDAESAPLTITGSDRCVVNIFWDGEDDPLSPLGDASRLRPGIRAYELVPEQERLRAVPLN